MSTKIIRYKKPVTLASVIVAVIIFGTYLGLAFPSVVIERSGSLSTVYGNLDIPVNIGFPKNSFMMQFTYTGSGNIILGIYDSQGNRVYDGTATVLSKTITLNSTWLPAGEYVIKFFYVFAAGSYNLKVIAKGFPF